MKKVIWEKPDLYFHQLDVQVPCLELEFLAKYLAELTLLEYSFLKFLPSNIAASAVFLARWTLNQSDHPWVCNCWSLINLSFSSLYDYKVSEGDIFCLFSLSRTQPWSITLVIKHQSWKIRFLHWKICSSTLLVAPWMLYARSIGNRR